jgi:hypothetical protein
MIFITQRIARTDVFETNSGAYVAATDKFFGILFVGVHLEQTGNPFFLS